MRIEWARRPIADSSPPRGSPTRESYHGGVSRDSLKEASTGRLAILDVAERYFSMHSYEAASLRKITEKAGVSIGLVRHHFGSKLDLLEAIYERRLKPLVEDRIRSLDALYEREPSPSLESLFEATVEPLLRYTNHPEGGMRASFLLRGFFEHEVHWPLVLKYAVPAGARALDAYKRVLADEPADEVESRWFSATNVLLIGLLPASRNVEEPLPPNRLEVERLCRHAFFVLAERAPARPLAEALLENWPAK